MGERGELDSEGNNHRGIRISAIEQIKDSLIVDSDTN